MGQNRRVLPVKEIQGAILNAPLPGSYADSKLVGSVTKEEIGNRWVLKNSLWIWVDSETFPWRELPQNTDLPVDCEIDYIRV